MYRIEVAPGEESVFRTIEELAVGIRNGVVTPRARIYHHASEKWLPIGLHPHYKKALEMPAASSSHAPVTSTTPIPTPSRPKAHPTSHPQSHSATHLPEPKRAPDPKRAPEPTPTPEPKPVPKIAAVPKAAAVPRISLPVQSPVIAMQNEVLRDLPVISIPEPLPWNVKPSPAVAPTVTAHAPAVHAPAVHAPVTRSPVMHAPVAHAPVTQAPATHAQAPQAPRAPRAPERYRSMEYVPPVEERRQADADELPLPRPTARRSRRTRGRPILLLGAAAALVVGTHLVLTATPWAFMDPAATPTSAAGSEEPESSSAPPSSEADQPAALTGAAESRATEAPRVTIAPARVSMTPGPAFAGSVPARPGADSAGTAKATARAPAPAAAEPSIAPAPAAIELSLPGLPPDAVVPTARAGDTMGMKRILRALNGAKPPEGSAAP